MATGSGKTIVMAMLAAWQILNKVSNLQDTRYSKHILIVTPSPMVKERLHALKTDRAHHRGLETVRAWS